MSVRLKKAAPYHGDQMKTGTLSAFTVLFALSIATFLAQVSDATVDYREMMAKA
jgi:hypothetical protein